MGTSMGTCQSPTVVMMLNRDAEVVEEPVNKYPKLVGGKYISLEPSELSSHAYGVLVGGCNTRTPIWRDDRFWGVVKRSRIVLSNTKRMFLEAWNEIMRGCFDVTDRHHTVAHMNLLGTNDAQVSKLIRLLGDAVSACGMVTVVRLSYDPMIKNPHRPIWEIFQKLPIDVLEVYRRISTKKRTRDDYDMLLCLNEALKECERVLLITVVGLYNIYSNNDVSRLPRYIVNDLNLIGKLTDGAIHCIVASNTPTMMSLVGTHYTCENGKPFFNAPRLDYTRYHPFCVTDEDVGLFIPFNNGTIEDNHVLMDEIVKRLFSGRRISGCPNLLHEISMFRALQDDDEQLVASMVRAVDEWSPETFIQEYENRDASRLFHELQLLSGLLVGTGEVVE